MALPAFRRFLFRSIQSAGILAPTTNGTDGRNLDFYEGRRSLGFELLRDADTAQPGDLQHPHSIMTLLAVLREERSEEHTSELQSLMRSSYAVFCLKKKRSNVSYIYSSIPNTRHLTSHDD